MSHQINFRLRSTTHYIQLKSMPGYQYVKTGKNSKKTLLINFQIQKYVKTFTHSCYHDAKIKDTLYPVSVSTISCERKKIKFRMIAHQKALFFAVLMSFITRNQLISFRSYNEFTYHQKYRKKSSFLNSVSVITFEANMLTFRYRAHSNR